MDPTPFHHCDLDTDAQEYLESWAMGYPANSHFRIIVHIQDMPSEDPTQVVVDAIHNYFDYREIVSARNLRLLLLEGRTSLLIGASFLAMCLISADLLTNVGQSPFWRVLKESLLIGGWVAMWRPMQIFLYEWWPLVRRGRIFRRLSSAIVHVVPAKKLA